MIDDISRTFPREFSGNNIWFTSDTHWCHKNVIAFCDRPFKDVEEMNEALIRNWNETVPGDGIVFHLGDFCFGGATVWKDICSRLNGNIVLIVGNHDLRNWRNSLAENFWAVSHQMCIYVDGKLPVLLNHYPFLCYAGSYRDVWQLFGHVHTGCPTGADNSRMKYVLPTQYDVGVDNNSYRPISWYEVKRKIEQQLEQTRGGQWEEDI